MFVCTSCTEGAADFLQQVQAALPGAAVSGIDCMSGCAKAQTMAFRAAGKVAYLFGELDAGDLPDLQRFAALYQASNDGRFDDARVLGGLRMKALARIPG